jgi:hypothetical protein
LVTGFDGNFRKDRRGKTNNRELNREFFEFPLKSIEFCPKSANFALEQGINREFCGYLTEASMPIGLHGLEARVQKINRELAGDFPLSQVRGTPKLLCYNFVVRKRISSHDSLRKA